MNRRIIIAGASGFIGQELVKRFRSDGYSVQLIGRTGPDARWGATAAITDLLEGADVLINLAGKSVNCRYNARNRAEISSSRLDTTRELARAMADCEHPPTVWFNASTATIYRHAEDRAMDERGGELGAGFSVDVATSWEQAFFERKLPDVRRIALRMAIVLGHGSVMVPLRYLVRFGLGGPQRDGRWFSTAERRRNGTYHRFGARGGRQKFSWVHLDDVYGSIRFLMEHDDIDGVVNVVSPQAADNRTLMSTLRRAMSIPLEPALRSIITNTT